MFAVPGWAVSSAALKTQTSAPSKRTTNGTASEGDGAAVKKRKLSSGKSKEKDVNSANLAEMWESVIEGKDGPRKEKKRKMEREVDVDGKAGTAHEVNGEDPVEVRPKEMSNNKKKKEKREQEKIDVDLAISELPSTNGDTIAESKPQETNAAAKRMIRHALEIPNPTLKDTDKSEEEFGGFSDADEAVNAQPKVKKAPKVPNHEAIEDAAPVATAQPNEKERKKEGKTKKEKKREKKAALLDQSISTPATIQAPATPKSATKLTPLQASMRQKLISARFRHLNQTLYTTPSTDSLSLFAENPEMFSEYHEGFRRQVEVWPENPVDVYLTTILSRGKVKGSQRGPKDVTETEIQALPRTSGRCTIADLGCGDAALSQNLQSHLKPLHLSIHSFDLQSPSPLVTKADIANLPLKDGNVDIAIFCLALMGTNWIDFIEEAWRILRWKGELWVAEIKSRFGRVNSKGGKKVVEHSVGNRKRDSLGKEGKKIMKQKEEAIDDAVAAVEVDGADSHAGQTDVSAFVEVLRKRGFVLSGEVDLSNKMFVRMCFTKSATPMKGKNVPVPKGGEQFSDTKGKTWEPKGKKKFVEEEKHVSSEAGVLKPCVYKLR